MSQENSKILEFAQFISKPKSIETGNMSSFRFAVSKVDRPQKGLSNKNIGVSESIQILLQRPEKAIEAAGATISGKELLEVFANWNPFVMAVRMR